MNFDGINGKYREIWKSYLCSKNYTNAQRAELHINHWPLQYSADKMVNNSVLFVGFNPAFDDQNPDLLIAENLYSDPSEVLDDSALLNRIIESETKVLNSKTGDKGELYRYYSLFPKIVNDVTRSSGQWTHLDLLPLRETSQSKLIEDLKLNGTNLFSLTEAGSGPFVLENISVFCEAIKMLEPKVIVIVNGYVSKSIIASTGSLYKNSIPKSKDQTDSFEDDFAGGLFSINTEGFGETGARILKIGERGYPLIVTSMLTGQRDLDLGSRERLVWHLKLLLGQGK